MREIILDTETTGLDPQSGHRIIEIGCLELANHVPTGATYHQYINPERDVPVEAYDIHGLSDEFLSDKPVFAAIAEEFLAFIEGALLVIHNAPFDMGFLNAELARLDKPPIPDEQSLDTLVIARKKHPHGPNSLDALCKRYGIDNSGRTKHGALLDSELLAEVYLELIGGRQPGFVLDEHTKSGTPQSATKGAARPRPKALPSRITDEERAAHGELIDRLGNDCIWKKTQNA